MNTRNMIREDGSTRPMKQERYIAIPELLAAVNRLGLCVDPAGVFGIINITTNRAIFTFHLSLNTFASFIIIFLWLDFAVTLKSVFAKKYKKSVFANKLFRRLIVALFSVMIVSDIILNILGNYGVLGLNFNVILSSMYIFLILFRAVASLFIANDLLSVLRKNDRSVSTTENIVSASKPDSVKVNSTAPMSATSSSKDAAPKRILNSELIQKVTKVTRVSAMKAY
jgi:hypothetical protein